VHPAPCVLTRFCAIGETGINKGRCSAGVVTSAAVLVGSLILSGVSAAGTSTTKGASTPKGGAIQIIVQPGAQQGAGKIIVTGAIGDYGTTSPSKTKGKTKYGVAKLTKGGFEVDLTAISNKVNSASPTPNSATCSVEISATAPAAISDGTGAYKGIKGSINLTETFGFIAPRYTSGKKKGQCNWSNNATPVAQMGTVYGTGSVSF